MDDMTVLQLKARAKELGLRNYHKLKKADLVNLIRNSTGGGVPEQDEGTRPMNGLPRSERTDDLGGMKLVQLREIAKQMGIARIWKHSKIELINEIKGRGGPVPVVPSPPLVHEERAARDAGYEKMKVVDLKKLASNMKIVGYGKMLKVELIEAIRQRQSEINEEARKNEQVEDVSTYTLTRLREMAKEMGLVSVYKYNKAELVKIIESKVRRQAPIPTERKEEQENLQSYTVVNLRNIAKALGINVYKLKKTELVESINQARRGEEPRVEVEERGDKRHEEIIEKEFERLFADENLESDTSDTESEEEEGDLEELTVENLRNIAKDIGINAYKLKKAELIESINRVREEGEEEIINIPEEEEEVVMEEEPRVEVEERGDKRHEEIIEKEFERLFEEEDLESGTSDTESEEEGDELVELTEQGEIFEGGPVTVEGLLEHLDLEEALKEIEIERQDIVEKKLLQCLGIEYRQYY